MLLVDDDQADVGRAARTRPTACRRRRRRRRGGCAATGRGARRRTGRCAGWRRGRRTPARNSAATAGVSAISGTSISTPPAGVAHGARRAADRSRSCRCRSRRAGARRGTCRVARSALQPVERRVLLSVSVERLGSAHRPTPAARVAGRPVNRSRTGRRTDRGRRGRSARLTSPARARRATVSAAKPRVGELRRRQAGRHAAPAARAPSRCLAVSLRATADDAPGPRAVIAATRSVLCASARPPRVFGGRTAVIVSPGAGRVVLGRPPRQLDDVRRNERARVEHLANRLDRRRSMPSRRRAVADDDAGDHPRAERHDDARADRRARGRRQERGRSADRGRERERRRRRDYQRRRAPVAEIQRSD